jgi:hypothetical protein
MPKDYANNFNPNTHNRALWLLLSVFTILVFILVVYSYQHFSLKSKNHKPIHSFSLPKNIDQWTQPNGANFLIAYHNKDLQTAPFKHHSIHKNMSLIGPFSTLSQIHHFMQQNPSQYTKIPKIIYIPHTHNKHNNTGITE